MVSTLFDHDPLYSTFHIIMLLIQIECICSYLKLKCKCCETIFDSTIGKALQYFLFCLCVKTNWYDILMMQCILLVKISMTAVCFLILSFWTWNWKYFHLLCVYVSFLWNTLWLCKTFHLSDCVRQLGEAGPFPWWPFLSSLAFAVSRHIIWKKLQ